MTNHSLAIVIPAYKGFFFRATLESLAQQHDQRFNLYIGDDGSPDGIDEIVKPFQLGRENIFYHRFENNLGEKNLVGQWERCLSLTNGESWLWLLGDDDILDPFCVERFYQSLEKSKSQYDIYRFDKYFINEKGKITELAAPHPTWEPAIEFAYYLITSQRSCTISEYIFSRKAFHKAGGFVRFPAAWGSDWCSWLSIGVKKGFYKVPGAKISHRLSSLSISGSQSHNLEKIIATLDYCEWLIDFFKTYRTPDFPISLDQWNILLEEHFLNRLKYHHQGVPWKNMHYISQRARKIWGGNTSYLLKLAAAQYIAKRHQAYQVIKRFLNARSPASQSPL